MQEQGDEMRDGDEVVSRLKIHPEGHENAVNTCHCVGPQNGEPMCPCRMRRFGVEKRDGRWVIPERDLGPTEGS